LPRNHSCASAGIVDEYNKRKKCDDSAMIHCVLHEFESLQSPCRIWLSSDQFWRRIGAVWQIVTGAVPIAFVTTIKQPSQQI
jgi:hypothetical protein